MRSNALIAFVVVAFLAGCGGASKSGAPTHKAIVLTSEEAARINSADVRTAGEAWLKAAVREPGSTLSVYVAPEHQDSPTPGYQAAVPMSWAGGDAIAMKAAWISGERRNLLAASTRNFAPAAEFSTESGTESTEVEVLPRLDSRGQPWRFLTGCPQHTWVICDLSASTGSECTATVLLRAFDSWIAGGVAPGSTFQVVRVGTSISTARRIFIVETPSHALGERVAFLLGVRNELSHVDLRPNAEAGSAIVEAITVAVTAAPEKRGEVRLLVLSDLRQVTPGPDGFDFARLGVPRYRFINFLSDNRLAPESPDLTVIACGVHAYVSVGERPLEPRTYAEIREIWTTVFKHVMRVRSLTICSACDTTSF